MKWLSFALVAALSYNDSVDAVLTSPVMFTDEQPDNTSTGFLRFYGSPQYHFMTDNFGYTVVKDPNDGFIKYAVKNPSSGELEPSSLIAGKATEADLAGFQPFLKEDTQVTMIKCEQNEFCADSMNQRRTLVESGSRELLSDMNINTMNDDGSLVNLVVPMKFGDHADRDVFTADELDVFFDSEDPDEELCLTGSVSEVFEDNSDGLVVLDSVVLDWVQLDPQYTEEYCAGGTSGLGTIIRECLEHALSKVSAQLAEDEVEWSEFDEDENGVVDSIIFMHSGYGAEFGGHDNSGAFYTDRIWSHSWTLDCDVNAGVKVGKYAMASSFHGFSNKHMARVGNVAHELFNALGLPVMYDGYNGQGIGSFDLMANSWGQDGSAYYPPMMSPWTRAKLGWLDAIEIKEDGMYEIPGSTEAPKAYKICTGFPEDEYLYIENRQPRSFDSSLLNGGLAIYHVDETASWTEEGHPGLGDWPRNGKHYRVALLQADGNFDLEKNENRGNSFDLFRKWNSDSIGPNGISEGISQPNTKSYQGGNVQDTGVTIFDISESDDLMTFQVSFSTNLS